MFKHKIIQVTTALMFCFVGLMNLGEHSITSFLSFMMSAAWMYTLIRDEDGVVVLWNILKTLAFKIGDAIRAGMAMTRKKNNDIDYDDISNHK